MSYKYYFTKTPFEFDPSLFMQAFQDQVLRQALISIRLHPESAQICMEFKREITTGENLSVQALIDANDPASVSPYKIEAYLNPEFKHRPIETIDFKRHKIRPKAFNPKITMQADGRPTKKEFFDGTNKIGEIIFEFETSPDNLLTRKKRTLYYLKEDESLGPPIVIEDTHYDLTDPNITDGVEAFNERVVARGNIVDSMKAQLSGFLMQALSETMPQVIGTIYPFWVDTESHRNDFINLGTAGWKDYLLAIDLTTTPHTWMSLDMGGVNVRDYMVSRLTY